jgi:hypothetical protein
MEGKTTMDEKDQSALREQYQAPALTGVAPEVLEYIQRLEQGIVYLVRIRNQYEDYVFNMTPPPHPGNAPADNVYEGERGYDDKQANWATAQPSTGLGLCVEASNLLGANAGGN